MKVIERCRKCNGKLYIDHSTYGDFVCCIMCGWERKLDSPFQNKPTWHDKLQKINSMR